MSFSIIYQNVLFNLKEYFLIFCYDLIFFFFKNRKFESKIICGQIPEGKFKSSTYCFNLSENFKKIYKQVQKTKKNGYLTGNSKATRVVSPRSDSVVLFCWGGDCSFIFSPYKKNIFIIRLNYCKISSPPILPLNGNDSLVINGRFLFCISVQNSRVHYYLKVEDYVPR